MTHLFKIPLQHADMFISHIDIEKHLISYEMRDKNSGILIEPPINNDVFSVLEDRISFSKRFIKHDEVYQIHSTLNL